MSRGTKVTREDFDTMKYLLAKKRRNTDIAKITGRGDDTIRRIKNAATWEDWLADLKDKAQKRAEKGKESQPTEQAKTEQISISYGIQPGEDDIKRILEELKQLNEHIMRVVMQREAQA